MYIWSFSRLSCVTLVYICLSLNQYSSVLYAIQLCIVLKSGGVNLPTFLFFRIVLARSFELPCKFWNPERLFGYIKYVQIFQCHPGKQMGKQCKQCQTLFFLGSKITADGDCSHEIERCLPLGRKVMTNLDSILKSRDITLPTKVRLVKTTVFPVVIYGCESWTVKKAER